jgi:hypothetical protein
MSWPIVYRRRTDARITVLAPHETRERGLRVACTLIASGERCARWAPAGVEISRAEINASCGRGGQG